MAQPSHNRVSTATAVIFWAAAAGAVFYAAKHAQRENPGARPLFITAEDRRKAEAFVDCKLSEIHRLAEMLRETERTGVVPPELIRVEREGVETVITRNCEAETGYTKQQFDDVKRYLGVESAVPFQP